MKLNGKKTYIGLALHAIWFAIYIYGEITWNNVGRTKPDYYVD